MYEEYNRKYLSNGGYVVFNNNTIIYYNQEGKIHNDIGPALIFKNLKQFWYKNSILHSDKSQPTIIYKDGLLEYYINNNFIKREIDLIYVNKHLINFEKELEIIYNM